MATYSLGLDFGTESVRALLVDLESGREAARAEFRYPGGVISDALPVEGGPSLGRDWFLQDPEDYLTGLETVVPRCLQRADARGDEVVGIGLDFTSCTVLPVDRRGEPLCTKDEFRAEPQAWVKLWKHHGAAAEADRILSVAEERGEEFLDYYAHTISSEWLMPKVLEVLHRAPEIYEGAHTFVEAADWVTWRLTGRLVRNACCAGYKGQYVADLGWPSGEMLAAVEPRMRNLFAEKMPGQIVPPGTRVGGLTGGWADRLGLPEGTPVAAPLIDAHAALVGCGITEPGTMALVLGTSFCHMTLAGELKLFEGVSGTVKEGILPGWYGYESGQTAGGDVYAWCVQNCVPAAYEAEAERREEGLHELLTGRARRLKPGQSGMLGLDWFNGNRSVLMDAQLSGLLVGLTLETRPEEIYRTCIEATMFGTRRIVQAYRDADFGLDRFIACGGLPYRNELAMQILADVLNHPVHVAASEQTTALGSALLGAAAAGSGGGGFDSVAEAAERVVRPAGIVFEPDAAAAATYDGLYEDYLLLHDFFGRSERLMHRLRSRHAGAEGAQGG
ncbi:MAG: ribulokinase [Planctomycetota bacterium]